MKIGFDARMMSHPGIGRYISCLLPGLLEQAPESKFVLFGDEPALQGLELFPNARVVHWTAPIYSLKEQVSQPYSGEDLDLLHVPHFNIPISYKGRMVVTIHDLIYVLMSRSVPSPLARYYARFMIGSCVKKTSAVISVSEHTKKDITRIWPDSERKISVVPEAADGAFSPVDDVKLLDAVKKKYSLPEHYILYVGSIKPHKNVSMLIQAFKRVKERGLPHSLVIAGRWDAKEDHLKEHMVHGPDIKYIGEVPGVDLSALYSGADLLAHVSLYEGFGLTVLEAMQCGTPVVVSNTSSLPEVAGTAAEMVDPYDIGQISEAIYKVLTDEKKAGALARSGIERAAGFSWDRTVGETLEVYKKAGRQ